MRLSSRLCAPCRNSAEARTPAHPAKIRCSWYLPIAELVSVGDSTRSRAGIGDSAPWSQLPVKSGSVFPRYALTADF